MGLDRLNRDIKNLRDKVAKFSVLGFSYYEQELIRRVFLGILPQLKDSADISTAKDILKRTEWLDEQ